MARLERCPLVAVQRSPMGFWLAKGEKHAEDHVDHADDGEDDDDAYDEDGDDEDDDEVEEEKILCGF